MNLRKLAKGKPCQVRLPGICNNNPETTVLAHLNGGGMGMKQPDLLGAWCCSDCHDVVDGRAPIKGEFADRFDRKAYIRRLHLEGIIRTQQELLKMGLAEVIEEWR